MKAVATDGYRSPVTPTPGTQPRQIRIPDQLWSDFEKSAAAVNSERSALVREFMLWHTRAAGAKLPKRPERAAWDSDADE